MFWNIITGQTLIIIKKNYIHLENIQQYFFCQHIQQYLSQNFEFSFLLNKFIFICGFHVRWLWKQQEWAFKLDPHYGSSRLREYGSYKYNAHDPKISKENGDNLCVYPKATLTLWIIFLWYLFICHFISKLNTLK